MPGAPRQSHVRQIGTSVLLTLAEAAIRLRVRESWLPKKAAARTVPCTFLGKHLRFSEADLGAIVAEAAVGGCGEGRGRADGAHPTTLGGAESGRECWRPG